MARKKKKVPVEYEGVLHKPRQKCPHVAEEYAAKGDRETAESLCMGLTADARVRVIG